MYRSYNCCPYKHALHLDPNRADEYLRHICQPARVATRYSPMVRHSILDRQWYMAARNSRRYGSGRRGNMPSSATVSPLPPAAGQPILPYPGSAGKFPGKGRETEGGEASALILRHPASAWAFWFFSTLVGSGVNPRSVVGSGVNPRSVIAAPGTQGLCGRQTAYSVTYPRGDVTLSLWCPVPAVSHLPMPGCILPLTIDSPTTPHTCHVHPRHAGPAAKGV
jgi:hypothetical protein